MYVVFQDYIGGIKRKQELDAETLSGAIHLIQTCKSQKWMYFIYRLDHKDIPLIGTKMDAYVFVKAVAGSRVEPATITHRQGLQYALTNNSSTAWFFTDDIYGDYS